MALSDLCNDETILFKYIYIIIINHQLKYLPLQILAASFISK
jgi:hypothetical protein